MKTIRKGRHRYILAKVPGSDGHYLICHPAVEASCPRCGAAPGVPCSSSRGTVMLTMAHAKAAWDYVEGRTPSPTRRQKLRERLADSKFYRSKPHEERKARWHELGMDKTKREPGRLKRDCLNSLRSRLEQGLKILDEMEKL